MFPPKLQKFFTARHIINLVAFFIIVYMGVATLQVISKNYQLQKEVDSLEGEIDFLKLRNNELEYEVAYYKTDSFADREARDKLGLQAPGEQTVILSDKVPPLIADVEDENANQAGVKRAFSNFEQWLYFLFKKEPS